LLRGSTLSRKLARTLEGESGLNDPVAVLLVLGFIDLLTKPGCGVADFVLLFVRELGIGVLVGSVAVYVLRRARLATAGLYPVAILTVVALAYGGADTLHGSGFLSIYLAGLTSHSVGNIVFFAVLVSTVRRGSTFEPFAPRLGLTINQPALPRPLSESGTIRRLGAEVLEFTIAPEDAIASAKVRDLGLPRARLSASSSGATERSRPGGSTQLRAVDELHLLVSEESTHLIHDLLSRWRTGPIGPPPRPARPVSGHRPIFSVWSWNEEHDGDASHPRAIAGQPAIEQLRIRRDQPGGLWVLADGHCAVTGPLAAVLLGGQPPEGDGCADPFRGRRLWGGGPGAARWRLLQLDSAAGGERSRVWKSEVLGRAGGIAGHCDEQLLSPGRHAGSVAGQDCDV